MMYSFSWINVVWEQLSIKSFFNEKSYKVQPLPDEIIVEILSRLPAEKVLECRRVCKHWNTLTSTLHFAHKHLRNTSPSPSILIAYRNNITGDTREERVFLFEDWGETRKIKNKIKKLGPKKSIYPVPIPNHLFNTVGYDHSGLLVFNPGQPLAFPYNSRKSYCRYSLVLYNPVTRQNLPLNTHYGFICAFYYHPSTEEYRVLWCQGLKPSALEYQVLNLGSPTGQLSWRKLPKFKYLPGANLLKDLHSLVLNNKVIHWITSDLNNTTQQPWCYDSILMFDINNEEFSTMPHPGDKCVTSRSRHRWMHLLELKCGFEFESLLCLCDCSMQDQIDMWVLEDYEKRIWVRRHRIVLDIDIYCSRLCDEVIVVPFALINGQMLINLGKLGVFLYHLSTGILQRIIEVVNGSIGFKLEDHTITYVGLFHKSLASFTNFKGLHFNMESC